MVAMATTAGVGTDLALFAHLLRRAGFGATRDELERYQSMGYEATVEELLLNDEPQVMPDDLIRRYQVDQSDLREQPSSSAYWVYRMVTTNRPLREKIALFWHRIFATGQSKLIQGIVLINQIEMFRKYGMGSFRDLLVELSRDPAMILWLDNQDNHNGAINENYGRELLELFSMGVGNYSEEDVKVCSRAFTGWTIANPKYMSIKMRNNTARPYGYIALQYDYDEDDHDAGEKTFLGETGNLNGEDVIDIICRHPATAGFIARHFYHHFVADEAPVPQWPYTPPKDPEAIRILVDAYFESDYSIGAMLRTMFNSDFFKSTQARFARVKSPAEVVIGALRLAGGFDEPTMEVYEAAAACTYMGQSLFIPPSVEGWQGGDEWINTGSLVQRVNYAGKVLGDTSRSGVRSILNRIKVAAEGGSLSSEQLVDGCLDQLGPLPVPETTRDALIDFARKQGEVIFTDNGSDSESENKIAAVLQLIVATREHQMA